MYELTAEPFPGHHQRVPENAKITVVQHYLLKCDVNYSFATLKITPYNSNTYRMQSK